MPQKLELILQISTQIMIRNIAIWISYQKILQLEVHVRVTPARSFWEMLRNVGAALRWSPVALLRIPFLPRCHFRFIVLYDSHIC
jgi:hypothetical protein